MFNPKSSSLKTTSGRPALPTCLWAWLLRPHVVGQLCLPVLDPSSSDHTWRASSTYLCFTLAHALHLVGQLYLPMLNHGSSKHTWKTRSTYLCFTSSLRQYLVSQFNLPVQDPSSSDYTWKASSTYLYTTLVLQTTPGRPEPTRA